MYVSVKKYGWAKRLAARLTLPLIALLLMAASCNPQTTQLTVVIANPNADVTIDTTLTVDVTVTGGTPDEVALLLDNAVLAVLDAPYSYTWDASGVADGTYTLTARATLGGRTFTSDPRTITVEHPQPTLQVSITSPSADAYTNGTLNVQVDVTGDPADSVSLLLDGSLLATLTSPYAYSWDTTGLAEGSYTLTAQATLSSQTFTSDPRTVTVDRTSPTLTSRTPSPGATNVWLGEMITAVFSEDIDPSTVTDSSVTVTDAAATNLGKTLSVVGDTLTVTLTDPPTLPTTLTLSLSTAIADRAGNPLVLPSDPWSYDVPEWVVLGGALSAEPGLTYVSSSAVVLDGNSTPTVAWEESRIHVQQWDGTAWVPLGGALSAGFGPSAPSLGVDAAGTLTVAWHDDNGTNLDIHVQQWDGAAWVPLGGALSAEPGATDAYGPSVAVDAGGTPTVAWEESDGTAVNIYVQQWTGSAWVPLGGALSAEPGATDAYGASLAVDASGVPTVAWTETDGTTEYTYVQQWNGSAWVPLGGALSAEPGTTDASNPSLVVDAGGTLTVAWNETDGTTWNGYVQQWDGTAWVPLGGALSAEPGNTNAFAQVLAVGAGGGLTLAWHEFDGTVYNIYLQQWNGSAWVPLGGALSAEAGATYAQFPSLAVDAGGAPVVAWQEDDGTVYNLHVRRYNALP